MIKLGAKPTVEVVAALAIRRSKSRAGRGVWWIRGALPIFQVAGIALRRKSVENARGQLLVAFVALHRGMCAEKGEAVLVILHLLHRDIPTLNGVALRAIRSHLAAVNIRVAVGTVTADVRENWLNVTLDAFHFFVHAAQGIARFVVIEFRDSAYWAPSGSGVAVLARNGKGTMRVASGLFLRISGGMDRRRHHPHWARVGEGQEHPECKLE